jgi:hypothetical protein
MKLRASVIARLVLIGFLAAVAWGLHQRGSEDRGVLASVEDRVQAFQLTIGGQ